MSLPDGTDPDPATAPDPAIVSAVSVKLPPFWPADSLVWFAQVEAQFKTKNITAQATRYDYVVASLSPEIATEVRDLILHPSADAPYDNLKEQLVKRTAASEQRRLQQLFSMEELGDRKPTQLLRRFHQLLGDKAGAIDPSFLRELFLQRLPANVRMILASTTEGTSLDDLAALADKVMEVSVPTVSAVTTSQLSAEMEQLRSEITDLKELVKSLSLNSQQRPLKRRSASPAPPQRKPDLCWYHQRFADAANKCNPPCSWTSGNDQAGR